MPTRARSHILEAESIRRFEDALPAGWVYRSKVPDYGVDGEVEIFNVDGSSTGFAFNVQLRATDDPVRIDRVRLKIDELYYYRSLDVPAVVVRYGSSEGSLFWQWASNILSDVEVGEDQQTVTYRFREEDRWTVNTPAAIRRTLEVRRRLANFPRGKAVSLRIDLTAIPAADRYLVDRAIARALAESHGVLTRAGDTAAEIEAFARLESSFLAVGIDTLAGVTFDLQNPTPEDYLTSILYALVRIFRRHQLVHQAEALASLLVERRLAHYNQKLAFEACLALTCKLPVLIDLAIGNGLHADGPWYPLIAMTIAQAPQDAETRRVAMETFFDASLTAARGVEPAREAAVHYSTGNFYRSQRDFARSAFHYNRARWLRPAYLQAGYFLRELAGVLFLSGHYAMAARLYHEAAAIDPDDPDLTFLLGDAMLLSGDIVKARICFEASLARDIAPQSLLEAELKIFACDHLIAAAGLNAVPRRRAEASLNLRPDGSDGPEYLELLLRDVDAFHPLARFNLGIVRAYERNHVAAVHHFLACAFIQPQDSVAWANAAICALVLRDETLLLRIMSTAIFHMGTDAYDHFRAHIAAQDVAPDNLAMFDEVAMQFLNENERANRSGFTVRILDGDNYQALTTVGFDEA